MLSLKWIGYHWGPIARASIQENRKIVQYKVLTGQKKIPEFQKLEIVCRSGEMNRRSFVVRAASNKFHVLMPSGLICPSVRPHVYRDRLVYLAHRVWILYQTPVIQRQWNSYLLADWKPKVTITVSRKFLQSCFKHKYGNYLIKSSRIWSKWSFPK